MTDRRLFLSTAELPPRPDPVSGEPKPPRAPGFLQQERTEKKQKLSRVTDPSKAPPPPEGEGPLLTWFKQSRREALGVASWGLLFFPIGVTAMQGFSIEWMKYWQPWLMLPVLLLCVYSVQRTVECAVGAEWLKVGKSWVRLYELTEITAKHRSNAIHLDFTDSTGRVVMVQANDLQEDRYMWDLVYNGILHSVIASNAKTNSLLHSAFKIPRPQTQQQ